MQVNSPAPPATFSKDLLSFEEVLCAYFDCRRTKRWSFGALEFEVDYEHNLFTLYDDLIHGNWKPGKSSCFIVTQPVIREIFAASFRDSYACRKEKGIFAAISRLEHFIYKKRLKNHFSFKASALKIERKK